MGVLILDTATCKEVAELVERAAMPENHWRPNTGETGSRIELDAYRCAFSFTVTELSCGCPALFRHLTIFCRPNPAAAEQIGQLFGFAGGLDDWHVDVHPDPAMGAVRITQIVDPSASAMAS